MPVILLGDSSYALVYPKTANAIVKNPLLTLPIWIGTYVMRNEDKHFARSMSGSVSSRKMWYDTPLCILPAAALYGMKVAGVPSKSNWNRMLIGNGTGGAFVIGFGELMKHWTSIIRPDKSSHSSFPSRHTAIAFASAAMLEEEYGHLSPWVTVGGYSVATLTAFTRVGNHRHWANDIVGGFTLGTSSALLGYTVADMILKDKGVALEELPFVLSTRHERPSFLGVYSSVLLTPGHYSMGNGRQLSFKTGFSSGMEGAWFFTPRVGVGTRIGITDVLPRLNKQPLAFSIQWLNTEGGLYLSLPAGHRTLFGIHALGGRYWLAQGKNNLRSNNIGLNDLWSARTGISLDTRAKKHLSLRLYGDYGLLFDDCSHQQNLSFGISTNYRF